MDGGSIARAEFFVVPSHQIAELAGDGIAIDRGDGVLAVELRDLFAEALTQLDERLGDLLIDRRGFGRLVVPAEVDPHGAGVVANLSDRITQFILRQHFLDGGEAVAPGLVVFPGDGTRLTLLGGLVKKERLSRKLAGRGQAPAPIIATGAEPAALLSVAGLHRLLLVFGVAFALSFPLTLTFPFATFRFGL